MEYCISLVESLDYLSIAFDNIAKELIEQDTLHISIYQFHPFLSFFQFSQKKKFHQKLCIVLI
jgi:hypothetical protein